MDCVVSVVGTGIAELVTLPICNWKTQYQNGNLGILATAQQMHRNDGYRSFFRAQLPAIGAQIFSTSAKYTLYRRLQRMSGNENKILNGIMSGLVVSTITHPIDFIRVNAQMGSDPLKEIRSTGFMVLYRGYTKTLSKVVVGSALFLPLYDSFLERTGNPILSSLGSALVSTTIVHPLDYMKTRRLYGNDLRLRDCYRGLSLNLLRVVPHFMITMTIIQRLSSMLGVDRSK